MQPFWESLGRDLQESIKKLLRDYAEALILAIITALIIRWAVFGSYRVSQEGMLPNLAPGDFVVGYKLPFGLNLPFSAGRAGKVHAERFDKVIFQCEEGLCVQRVIGLPGDKIEVIEGKLKINNLEASYSVDTNGLTQENWEGLSHSIYLPSQNSINVVAETVPPDTFFLINDNREAVTEGQLAYTRVEQGKIEARVLFIWLSWDPATGGLRWGRIGHHTD